MADWARRFERILDRYRREDGSRWTGAAIERATRGEVKRNYVSALKNGRIAHPSFEKLDAISSAMGFPVAAWRGEDPSYPSGGNPAGGRDRR